MNRSPTPHCHVKMLMPRCPFCDKPISSDTTSCPYCRAPITTHPPTLHDLEQRIGLLLDRQQKIEAIKLYREETGSTLEEAKEAVDSFQSGWRLHGQERDEPQGFEADVLRLLGEGKKIEAIKLHRKHKGGGLKEAKEAVELLGERHGMQVRGRGCLGALLMVVITIVASIVAQSWGHGR